MPTFSRVLPSSGNFWARFLIALGRGAKTNFLIGSDGKSRHLPRKAKGASFDTNSSIGTSGNVSGAEVGRKIFITLSIVGDMAVTSAGNRVGNGVLINCDFDEPLDEGAEAVAGLSLCGRQSVLTL